VIALIVNPAAGGGRARRRAHDVAVALSQVAPVHTLESRAPGDEARCVTEALQLGARVVAVAGGDGSVHHAVRGLLSVRVPPPLAIFAAGTGNDFVKSLGSPRQLHAMVELVAQQQVRAVDVGYVNDVPFVNAAGIGFDVEVLQRISDASRHPRGALSYVTAALGALHGYAGFAAPREDERKHDTRATSRRLMMVFANGRHFGGAICIAPHASINDGALDLVEIQDVPPWRRVALLARAAMGRHLSHDAVRIHRASRWQLTFSSPPAFEADGELYRARSATLTVRVQPRALECIAPLSE
jgi:diacylglycerol kinase (ATP)